MVSLKIIKAAPIYRMRAIVQIISYTWRYINIDAWSISTPFRTRLWNLYYTVLTDVNCDLHINSQKPRLPYTSVVFALPPHTSSRLLWDATKVAQPCGARQWGRPTAGQVGSIITISLLSHPSIMLQILSLPLVFNHCNAILSTCVVFDQNKWPLFAESLFTKLVGQHSHMPTMATLGQHQSAAGVICRVKVHLLADLSYKCSLPPFPFSLSPSLLCLAFSFSSWRN